MKQGSLSNLFILFFVLIVVGFFYKQYSKKLEQEESGDVYEAIQKYLLDDVTLGKSKNLSCGYMYLMNIIHVIG